MSLSERIEAAEASLVTMKDSLVEATNDLEAAPESEELLVIGGHRLGEDHVFEDEGFRLLEDFGGSCVESVEEPLAFFFQGGEGFVVASGWPRWCEGQWFGFPPVLMMVDGGEVVFWVQADDGEALGRPGPWWVEHEGAEGGPLVAPDVHVGRVHLLWPTRCS